ncbi:MAG TPA: molecular chaperone DnaK, partial [Syntrophomonas sp.]|nr:molecular chaperone DnaK [Syntrophomonas sp.]
RFQLTGIPPAPRGVPQIEVKFDIDVNGIVNVTAKDLATNKEQKITITSSGGLSDEDIKKMMEDAERHAEEDERRFKEIEARNAADSLIYQSEKALKENGDKIDADSKRPVEDAIAALKTSLEGSDVEDIKAKTEALTQAFYAVSSKLYEQAQGDQQGAAPGGAADDEVFDADYRVEDESK